MVTSASAHWKPSRARIGAVLKEVEMKNRSYTADGFKMLQTFPRFADARRAAMRAPWANGLVYRHNCNAKDDENFGVGKLCFTAPGAPYPN